MNSLCQTMLFSSRTLREQVGRLLRSEQGDFGPFWILLDERGAVRPADTVRLSKFAFDSALLGRMCAAVDDGAEPVIEPAAGAVMAAAQLCTEQTNCGYMLLVLPGYTMETAQANIELIEMLISQLNLLAGAVEKSGQLLFADDFNGQPGNKEKERYSQFP